MPDRPSTIVLYAASAVFAAMGLAYIFGPTLFPDSAYKIRAAGAVGLSNPANDCFINSVLQALAGTVELRQYLKEIVDLLSEDDPADGNAAESEDETPAARRKASLHAPATESLKVMLDILSERPRYRKTVSAGSFIGDLEHIFSARLSRRQQDAQEFAQVVLERLDDEHVALKKNLSPVTAKPGSNEIDGSRQEADLVPKFPLTGQLSSQIDCQSCQYQPSPTNSSFLTLSLNVPRTSAFSSTSLDVCLDGLLKVETIEGYKCARCTVAALLKQKRLERSSPAKAEDVTAEELEALLKTPMDSAAEARLSKIADSTDLGTTPVRLSRIQKHVSISAFPPVLFIHLSRSIFDSSSSSKNMARVEFPELLALGRIGERRKKYLLSAIICHKGAHESGHYETFRRQTNPPLDVQDILEDEAHADDRDCVMIREKGANENNEPVPQRKGSSTRSHKPVDRWWRISDDKVSECKTKDVLNMQKEVYILLYELKK